MMSMLLLVLGFSNLFKGSINFTVKEAYTGEKIGCHVDIYREKNLVLSENINGSWKVLLKQGNYELKFSKTGYFPVFTHFYVKKDTVLNVTVYLTPRQTDSIFPKNIDGLWIIRGYVTDENNNPLGDVLVKLSTKNLSTITDKRGIFEFSLPVEHTEIGHEFIPKDTLILSKKGYKTFYREIFNLEKNVVLHISLEKGTGTVFKKEFKSPGTGGDEVTKHIGVKKK